jgi:RNA polymerase sigma-70 factor (ECF subfamily)
MCLVTGSRQEANEIAQEAFVRILERWDRVASMDDPTGFLFRAAMNAFRKRYRRSRFVERLSIPQQQHDDAFAVVDDRDVLVRALRELTPRQRAAVVLTELLDRSSEEAGRILGISDSTVRVLSARARVALRTKVADDT